MSLCLSMIVKDEAHIIQRCLRSVKPFIDSYRISDTGSSDNTMEIIREELTGLPGLLTSDPWEDFGTNRNIALQGVTGTHTLLFDADETLVGTLDPAELERPFDCFELLLTYPGQRDYYVRKIIRNDPRWHYEGRTHEILLYDGDARFGRIEGLKVYPLDDSSRRNSGQKFLNDLYLLENSPKTPRTIFYLAQTLCDLGRKEEAIEKYTERALMGGWEEEVYFSLWKAAECKSWLKKPFHEVAGALFSAYIYRPSRYEALSMLCGTLRMRKMWSDIYRLSAIDPQPQTDILFINPTSEWLVLEEHALASYYLGKKDEAREYYLRVAKYNLSPSERERIENGLSFCQ